MWTRLYTYQLKKKDNENEKLCGVLSMLCHHKMILGNDIIFQFLPCAHNNIVVAVVVVVALHYYIVENSVVAYQA